MNDPTKNLPWSVDYSDCDKVNSRWVVKDSLGNVVFSTPSESLARMVAAGSVAAGLYAALEACVSIITEAIHENATPLVAARALAAAAPLMEGK